MKKSFINPLTWFSSAPIGAEKGVVPAESPSTTATRDGEPVAGTFVPDEDIPIEVGSAAAVNTERFRRIVNSFDEDKQPWLGWIVTQYFTVFSYLMPPITAFIVGDAIGDAFSGPFSLTSAYSLYAHFISVALEMAIPLLGLVVVTLCKRAVREKSVIPWCIAVSALFVLTSVGNSYAQMYLIDQHVNAASFGSLFGLYYRAYGPLLIDSFSAIFLSVVGVRNRKKFIANEREKNEAITDVAKVFIEQGRVLADADIAQKTARLEAEAKLSRAEAWNQAEKITTQKLIDAARRSQGDEGDGYRRGRY